MINLLPEKQKEELLFQKNRNLVVVLGSMAIIVLVCLALILLSLKFYILQIARSEESTLDETRSQYQTKDFLDLTTSLKKYNAELSRADNFYKRQVYMSNGLKTIVTVERPIGIIFNSVDLQNGQSGDGIQANIHGQSDTRENLITFKTNMEKQKGITNVYISPDDLIKPANINFYMTFNVTTSQ